MSMTIAVVLAGAGTAVCAQAPGNPTAPPAATSAPDVVLANEQVRVQRLVLGPGAATPMHTHAQDHLAVAMGGAEIAYVTADGTEQRRTLVDGALAFAPAGVTHSVRNVGAASFRAVTIDLLVPQTGARNRCAVLLAGQPTDCPDKAATAPSKKKDGALVPQMETAQTLVSLMTLAPGARHAFKPAPSSPLVVALEGTSATALVELTLSGGAVGRGERPLVGGDALCPPPKTGVTISNTGPAPARFVVVEFKPGGDRPGLSRAAFIDHARNAPCADASNRLFVIDDTFVFWQRAGSCPDNAYGATLFGGNVDDVLCYSGDSIAGPRKNCPVAQHTAMFEIITGHPDEPDLGLGSGHTVEELPL